MKKLKLILSFLFYSSVLIACAKTSDTANFTQAVTENNQEKIIETENESLSIEDDSFIKLVEEAKGSNVHFYMWGGDDKLNTWLETYFATRLKEKYDINFSIVPMGIEDILSQLGSEISAGKQDGDIDMIWINGENFRTARENDFLYGEFTQELPNFMKYIDSSDKEVNFDFAYPVEGYEAPYGKAQMIMYNDSAITPEIFTSTDELMEFVKKYKGKVTYPALPDFTGSAFVRNIIYDIVGYEQFSTMPADKELIKKEIEPALEYLRELNKYLWNEGKTFPESEPSMKNMFIDGELVMGMNYSAFMVASNIEDGTFTDTTRSFQFDKGTIGNTNYIAIAKNSANKSGAKVAINEMLDPEVQANRYSHLKTIPVVSYDKLEKEQREEFEKVNIGKGVIASDELLSKRLPEMPAALVPIIEEIWIEEVVGK